MTDKIKKPIENVGINYGDKTKDKMQYYAMIGWNDNTWYSVVHSPPTKNAKIRMRNKLIELSADLMKTINEQRD